MRLFSSTDVREDKQISFSKTIFSKSTDFNKQNLYGVLRLLVYSTRSLDTKNNAEISPFWDGSEFFVF